MQHERLTNIDFSGAIDLSSTERAKGAIRYHAENDPTWTHHEIAKRLYGWTDIFRDRFLDPIAQIGRGKLPGPLLGFEKTDYRTLAYYHLGHNAHGLEDEVILNSLYLDHPLYSILETVLHEQIHLWQQRFGKDPVKRNYHNKEFCDKALRCGLFVFPIFGFHFAQAGEPFESLLGEYGIAKPPEERAFPVEKGEKRNWWDMPDKEKKEGTSTLRKWVCPECGKNVRYGRRGEADIYCGCRRENGVYVLFLRASQLEQMAEKALDEPTEPDTDNPFGSLATLDAEEDK